MSRLPRVEPREITLRSLTDLAYRTVVDDRASYRSPARATLRDLFLSVWPSLRRPIFIIGAPRSGTTFLGRCFAALPEVSYHFEPVATKTAARYVYEGRWSDRAARFFYRGVYRWLLRVHLDGARRFAEKTPRNCFTVRFLADTFPDAQFIYIVRDGRDAALSHSKKGWLRADGVSTPPRFEAGGYPFGPYPRFWVEADRRKEFIETNDLHRCIWAWRRHNEAVLEQLPTVRNGAVLETRYEYLATRPAVEAERILDFLGIRRSDSRAAFEDATAAAHPSSVGRWQKEISGADLAVMESEAGAMLRQLGYPLSPPQETG